MAMNDSGLVDSGGVRLFYTAAGEGRPVMLLHGGLLDHRMFDSQVDVLSGRCRLLRMDLRGYGRSSVPDTAPYRHCDDVAAVLDALGVDRVVIGGESFGGAVALDFAFAFPDRVDGLIFDAAGPIPGWRWREGFPLKAVFHAAQADGVRGARRAMLETALLASAMERPAVAAALTAILEDYSGWHFLNRDPAAWAQPAAIEHLETVTAPALVIVGGRDLLDLRLMGDELAHRLANSIRHDMPRSGHVPNMEEPDTFNQHVIDFLLHLPH
ncbi:MAG: alpha/beta fold hydrolase [Acidimicrobiales bacterium]